MGGEQAAADQVDRLFGADPLARWEKAQALYRTAGANARFILVDGVGHDRQTLQVYSTEFFASVLKQ